VKTGFVTHPIYLQHETGPGHPESPQRLKAIERHLAESGLRSKLTWIEPTPPPDLASGLPDGRGAGTPLSAGHQGRAGERPRRQVRNRERALPAAPFPVLYTKRRASDLHFECYERDFRVGVFAKGKPPQPR